MKSRYASFTLKKSGGVTGDQYSDPVKFIGGYGIVPD
jgi:hypothetical protein